MIEMNQSLADAFKQLLQSLQVRFIFPAAFFVIANLLLFPRQVDWNEGFHIVVLCTLTVILSYLLNAFNGPIIRLVEGYNARYSFLYFIFALTERMEKRGLRRYKESIQRCKSMINQIDTFKDRMSLDGADSPEIRARLERIKLEWESKCGKLIAEQEQRFPPNNHLPTSFGNTIAAFESYPCTRYSMAAVALWPRLLPILEEKRFMPLVQNEKVVMDFLLNSAIITLLIALEMLMLFDFYQLSVLHWRVFILLLILVWLMYCAAVAAAKDWGVMVCSAFDLYREDLRQALRLPSIPDDSLDEEKKLWHAISVFILHGDREHFDGFVYSHSRP